MKSASLIYTKPNQWRANHYHKKIGILFMLSKVSLSITSKKLMLMKKFKKNNYWRSTTFTGPMIDHAMLYTKETEILVVSKNPRDQKTYEEDTVRIDFMNDSKRF